MTITGKVDASTAKERQGDYSYCVKRNKFLDFLRSKLPEDRVHYGRFVLEIVNGTGGVQCKCSNGTVYDADILVGADGGYSAVRQKLYQRLKEKGLLPKADCELLNYRHSALIGLTEPMDINAFPVVDARFIEVNVVQSKDNSYTAWYSSAPERRLVWCVTGDIVSQGRDDNFKSSDLGSESIESACMAVGHLKTPYGCSLSELIAKSPAESIIKFMVEEKHFKTWFDGRAVLIGEAAHKFEPLSGLGPDAAMLDAAILVNELCKLQYNDLREVTRAFEKYREKRVEHVKICINYSSTTSQFVSGHGLASDIKRKIAFKLPMLINSSQDRLKAMAWTKHPRRSPTLPHEILVIIFYSLEQRPRHRHTSSSSISFTSSYTLDRTDIFSCALVCHDWYFAAVDTLWRDIDLQSVESFIRFAQAIDKSFEYVQTVSQQQHASNLASSMVGSKSSSSRSSMGRHTTTATQQHHGSDASDPTTDRASEIKHSSRDLFDTTTVAVGSAGRSYIRSLSFAQLASCHGPRPFPYLPSCLTDRHIMALAPALDRLTSLSLCHCSALTDMAVIEIVTASSSHLKHLDLTECRQISNLCVQVVACLCTELERISLQGCGLVSDDAIVDIGRYCSRLLEIDLGHCQRVGDRGVLALLQTDSSQIDKPSHRLADTWSPTDYSAIRERVPRLQKINVAGCRGVTISGLMAIATFHNMVDPRSPREPEPTLTSFEFSCPVQRSANPGHQHHVPVTSLSSKAVSLAKRLFTALPKTVQEIAIADAHMLTPSDISCLVEHLGANLKSLRFDNGHSVTTPVLCDILSHCPSLCVLSLPRALKLTNEGVGKIAKAECAKSLVELDLSAAYELTDSCLHDLVASTDSSPIQQQKQQQQQQQQQGYDGQDESNSVSNSGRMLLPNLLKLDLSFNVKMTLKGIKQLVLALPALCTLDVSCCGAGITTPMPVYSTPPSPVVSTVGSRMHQANLTSAAAAAATTTRSQSLQASAGSSPSSSSTATGGGSDSTLPAEMAAQTMAHNPVAIAATHLQRRANLRSYCGPLLTNFRQSSSNNSLHGQALEEATVDGQQAGYPSPSSPSSTSHRRLSSASTSSSSSSSSSSSYSSSSSRRSSTYASSSRASSSSSLTSCSDIAEITTARLCERLDVIELTPRQVCLPAVFIQDAWFTPQHHLQLQQLAQVHFQQQDQQHQQQQQQHNQLHVQLLVHGHPNQGMAVLAQGQAQQHQQEQQQQAAILSPRLLSHPVMAAPRLGVATVVRSLSNTSRYSLRALGLEANELQGHCEISGWGLSKLREEWSPSRQT
ncbi:hypothetical protein BGZ73_005160 [Actinomortierella ambigua]|nr:hypothetical protein BGZ73_005160 [Actinomortierella ambigua]